MDVFHRFYCIQIPDSINRSQWFDWYTSGGSTHSNFIRNVLLQKSHVLRNLYACGGRIEKSIRRITVLQHGACQVMTNGDHKGRIFLSHPDK